LKNKNLNTRKLTIEKTKDSSLLSDFSCGIESIDDFIHSELQSYVDMGNCQLFIVRENGVIVAMYCLDNLNLHISEVTKSKMREGVKPMPQKDLGPDDFYWLKPFFDSVEITYLAVDKSKQHSHIGSFIVEYILNEIAADNNNVCDFVAVRALKCNGYSAVPFYRKCGFYAAEEEQADRNLFMYRIVIR